VRAKKTVESQDLASLQPRVRNPLGGNRGVNSRKPNRTNFQPKKSN